MFNYDKLMKDEKFEIKIGSRGYGKIYNKRIKTLKYIEEEFKLNNYKFYYNISFNEVLCTLINLKNDEKIFYKIDIKFIDNIKTENEIIGYVADIMQNLEILSDSFDKIFKDEEGEIDEQF